MTPRPCSAVGLVAVLLLAGPAPATPSESDAIDLLEAAWDEGDADAVCTALAELGPTARRDGVAALLGVGVAATRRHDLDPSGANRIVDAARDGLAACDHPSTVRHRIRGGVRRADGWRRKVLLLEALAVRDGPDDWSAIIEHGLDPDASPHVVRAALRIIARERRRDGIEPVIGVLERTEDEGGLVPFECLETLHDLTGQRHETGEDWRAWWRENAEGFDPASVPRPETAWPRPGEGFVSERIVFVLDVSESMTEARERTEEEGEGEAVPRRIQEAKDELSRRIRGLDRDVHFTVVTFSREITYLSGGGGFVLEDREVPTPVRAELAPASASQKESALRFVGMDHPGGTSWFDYGLRGAFLFDRADTIVVVSDGIPAHRPDDLLPTGPLLEEARALNRLHGARIHTICLSPHRHGYEGLLEELPAAHRGRHLHPPDDDGDE